MNLNDEFIEAVEALTIDGTFHIDRIEYDEKNFGNVLAVLNSKNQVDIRFIKDRGDFWCEVGQTGEWYFIEDVFTLIGIAFVRKSSDFIDFTTEISALIEKAKPHIFNAFNAKNSKDTQSKIKALATKRAMGMFKP